MPRACSLWSLGPEIYAPAIARKSLPAAICSGVQMPMGTMATVTSSKTARNRRQQLEGLNLFLLSVRWQRRICRSGPWRWGWAAWRFASDACASSFVSESCEIFFLNQTAIQPQCCLALCGLAIVWRIQEWPRCSSSWLEEDN